MPAGGKEEGVVGQRRVSAGGKGAGGRGCGLWIDGELAEG